MIIAPTNFRDEEYFVPKQVFENAGLEVVTASKNTQTAQGKLGKKARVDVDYSTQNTSDYDALVFVGGGGALVYENDPIVNNLIKEAATENKIIAAICIAPRILVASGILNNKKATAWNGDREQEKLINQVGQFINEPVVVDQNIITANGPESAKEFGLVIVNKLI